MKLGYLKTLYLALKYEVHYCRRKLEEVEIKIDKMKTSVYNGYLIQCNKFLYIISRLIVLEKGVEEREKKYFILEEILSKKEVEKLKKKYIIQEEFDYNFELCLKSFLPKKQHK